MPHTSAQIKPGLKFRKRGALISLVLDGFCGSLVLNAATGEAVVTEGITCQKSHFFMP